MKKRNRCSVATITDYVSGLSKLPSHLIAAHMYFDFKETMLTARMKVLSIRKCLIVSTRSVRRASSLLETGYG